jgi:hypothetical protein
MTKKTPSRPARKSASHGLRLRIVCLRPPDPEQHGAKFGLQEKRAGDWILWPGKRQRNGDFVFEFECEVTHSPSPDFRGQFIHGKRGERFVYLSWEPDGWKPGTPEPGPPHCVRRMKIHLKSISSPQVESALTGGSCLEAIVAGTAKDGGPNCASVPLLHGWQLETRGTRRHAV